MKAFFTRYKHVFKWSAFLAAFCFLLLLACNAWINKSTRAQLYNDITAVPARKVGLVLGASKNTVRGTDNIYFTYRMQAAWELYKSGKVQYLLLSGDNHTEDYDEPTDMRDALLKLGVPDSCIVLDYAGFRTLDSVVRCKEVFGEDSVTVISQEFHNQRALFIANKSGMHAIGFNAREVNKNYSFRTRFREYFARVKCVLDLYILHTDSKFLGEKIRIGK